MMFSFERYKTRGHGTTIHPTGDNVTEYTDQSGGVAVGSVGEMNIPW